MERDTALHVEDERASPNRGNRGGDGAAPTDDSRDPCLRTLDLPDGRDREHVWVRDRAVTLRGSEARLLAVAGAFRVVPASDVQDPQDDARTSERDARRLRDLGLVTTLPLIVGESRETLVSLTPRGRAVLEGARRDPEAVPRQAFYAGITKPRELAHDARVYRAAQQATERLAARDARVRRIVLEEELKREYQQFLQAGNRGRADATGIPDRDADAIAQWARDHQVPCTDGHVQFPDVRLEVDEADGRRTHEDIEVTTPHYRGAHAAAKTSAGFTRYRAVGARVGGGRLGGTIRGGRRGRGPDPHLAEELLR